MSGDSNFFLLVDNDDDVLTLNRERVHLYMPSLDVCFAYSLGDAFQTIFFDYGRIGLVMSDYRFDFGTGEEVVVYAQSFGLPCVMSSGKFRDTRADFQLRKPVDWGELYKILDKYFPEYKEK